MPTFTQDDMNTVVEQISEIGDLSYLLAPDPNPVGIQQRLRVQSIKHILHADPPPLPPAPGPMPAVMFDSVTIGDVPADAQIIAYYVDGDPSFIPSQAQLDALKAQGKCLIPITALGASLAVFCDSEPGDLTPGQAASWISQYPGNGVYCNRAKVIDKGVEYGAQAVIDAMNAAGIQPSEYWLGIADWTGQAHMVEIPGVRVLFTQFDNGPGHYDRSLVSDEFVKLYC